MDNKERCNQAKIPDEGCRQFKTKPKLALSLIKQDVERGVVFDWIGGDGLYGLNTKFCNGLEAMGLFYVLMFTKPGKCSFWNRHFQYPRPKPTKVVSHQKYSRTPSLCGWTI